VAQADAVADEFYAVVVVVAVGVAVLVVVVVVVVVVIGIIVDSIRRKEGWSRSSNCDYCGRMRRRGEEITRTWLETVTGSAAE
jgi:hypothetical protein